MPLIVPGRSLVSPQERLGIDLSRQSLDDRLPELPPAEQFSGQQGRYQIIKRMIENEHLTLRQVLQRVGADRGHRVMAGSPEQIADGLQGWFAAGAADGFTLMPAILPEDLLLFTEHVVPILRKRGLRRGTYLGRTLREHYGHPQPTNQFSAAK